MSVLRFAAAALLVAAPLVAGCSDDSKPAKPPAPAPASDMNIFKYLDDHNVAQQPQTSADEFPLRVSIRLPPNWSASQGYPGIYLLLENARATDQQFRPNAVIRVIKLIGNFDPKQAITRGYVDISASKNFQKVRDSLADFENFPSALIEGTYVEDEQQRKDAKARVDEQQRQNGQEPDPQEPVGDLKLHVLNRYVLATSGDDKYLVQLQATITDGQTARLAEDVKTIDQGLELSFKK